MPYPMKKKGMKYSSNGDIGCVKQAHEEKQPMLANGGGKYSHDNPRELNERANKLAKVVK